MHQLARSGRFGAVLLLLPCGLLAGCKGSSQGTVSGTVSYKGQPVKGGTVSIIPSKGGALTSPIKEDGSYTISKVPVGPAKIAVETASMRPPPKGAKARGPYAKMPKDAIPPGVDPSKVPGAQHHNDASRYVPIPPQYSDPQKSGLSYDVARGNQQHPIDLQ